MRAYDKPRDVFGHLACLSFIDVERDEIERPLVLARQNVVDHGSLGGYRIGLDISTAELTEIAEDQVGWLSCRAGCERWTAHVQPRAPALAVFFAKAG